MKALFCDKEYRRAWLIYVGSHFPCWFSRYIYPGTVFMAWLIFVIGYKRRTDLWFPLVITAFVLIVALLDYKGNVLLGSCINGEISVRPKRFDQSDNVVDQVETELPKVLEWAENLNKKPKFTTYEAMFSEMAERFEVPRSEFNADKELKEVENKKSGKLVVGVKDDNNEIILHPGKINNRICIKCKKGPQKVNHEKAIQPRSLFPSKAKLVRSTRAVQHYIFEIEWKEASQQ